MTEKKNVPCTTAIAQSTQNMSSRTQDDYTPNSPENQAFSFPDVPNYTPVISRDVDFTLVCKGYSMKPTIMDGDIVAIRQQPTVENGDIAAVRIGDKLLVSRVCYGLDTIILKPDNGRFLSTVLFGEEIAKAEIIGKVVELWRRFDHPKTPSSPEETSG